MLRSNTIEVCATKELERILPELALSMGGVRRIMGTPMPFAVSSSYSFFEGHNTLESWRSAIPTLKSSDSGINIPTVVFLFI